MSDLRGLRIEEIFARPTEVMSAEDIGQTAGVYADAFAGEPWNEYTESSHGSYFGRDTNPGESCPDGCGGKLALAYPQERTEGYIRQELERPDAALLLVRDTDKEDEIVGFSWGFSYEDPEAFAASKYKTPEMQTVISGLLRRLGVGSKLWYLSESGVVDTPEYRGRGLSRTFHEKRLAVARQLGLPAVQRTMNPGPMYRTSLRTMTQVMGPSASINPVTGKLTEVNLVVNQLDSENPARVLFIDR